MGVYVYTELIKHIGVTESIIFSQIHYWCDKNEKSRKGQVNGYYWCKRSAREFSEKDFEGVTERTVQRILKKLQDLGLIVAAKFKGVKVDNTNSYRVDYKRVKELYGIELGKKQSDKREIAENEYFDDIPSEAVSIIANNSGMDISVRAGIKESDEYISLLQRCEITEQEAMEHSQDTYNVLQMIKRYLNKKHPVKVKGGKASYDEMLEQIRLLKWNHIEYVADRLRDSSNIRNGYEYALSVIYDAVVNIDSYYQRKYLETLENSGEYEIDVDWIEKS